ncbi:GIY-YIG nuclease family protein [Thiohalomonas denitrificans]|uniref:GIY-YIG nuclease family protein n=1 Tax=Thiohalomonas denitrificans TaxID=415747 RepID=UPI0026EB22E2|nr:GIY-YIG nuclease family protein [Thiohalomonas denitrificans]
MVDWHVYIICCADGTLYTGVARDVERRLAEHNGGPRGARYTRGRRPVKLVYREAAADRAAACRREASIKSLSRSQKEALIRAAAAIPMLS